jgi:hypothetical protein
MRSDELDRSGRFGMVVVRRYEWEVSYTTAAYLEVLSTYCGHIALALKPATACSIASLASSTAATAAASASAT